MAKKMGFRSVVLAAGILAVAVPSFAGGNASGGAVVFARCAICHDNHKNGVNKIGPDLYGVVGRKAATFPGFIYSDAMKASKIVWTDAKLDAYLTSPATVVPGNKMGFAGIANAAQRADLIAYLDTLK